MTCQYCGAPSGESYTCATCTNGWPYEYCRCENNGDYCEACEKFIESRRAEVQGAQP